MQNYKMRSKKDLNTVRLAIEDTDMPTSDEGTVATIPEEEAAVGSPFSDGEGRSPSVPVVVLPASSNSSDDLIVVAVDRREERCCYGYASLRSWPTVTLLRNHIRSVDAEEIERSHADPLSVPYELFTRSLANDILTMNIH